MLTAYSVLGIDAKKVRPAAGLAGDLLGQLPVGERDRGREEAGVVGKAFDFPAGVACARREGRRDWGKSSLRPRQF